MNNRTAFLLVAGIIGSSARAQVLTSEDSLNAGLSPTEQATYFSGYGELKVSYDQQLATGEANLTRNVLFVGHRFNEHISLFSELELEDARVEGGELGGEISLEQMFIKFDLRRNLYLTAGLFTPRIGIINENHLPTTFNGNDRPYTETFVIPSTWREIGVSLYGRVDRLPGLNWSLGLVNGLNAANFENGTGIRGGRGEGSNASASNMAVTGSVLYYWKELRLQGSFYYGGAAGLTQRQADSLQLDYGAFGTPVSVLDANLQYHHKGFQARALASVVSIPDAEAINRAYANNTPEQFWGGYVEAGYDLLDLFAPEMDKDLVLFARYEVMDLDARIAQNGIATGTNDRTYFITGLNFRPVQGVVVKMDYTLRTTGEPNPALVVNPYPEALPYFTSNGFINIGFGYSF